MNGIVRTKGILGGKPVVYNTRIEPLVIFHLFMAGKTSVQIQKDYPGLSAFDVENAIRFVCALACPCKQCAWAKDIPLTDPDNPPPKDRP